MSHVHEGKRVAMHQEMRMGVLIRLGYRAIAHVRNLSNFYLFSLSILWRVLRLHPLRGITKPVFFRQILFSGYDALLLISFIAVSISALLVLEVHQLIGQMGKGTVVYNLFVVVVNRQLSSLLIALVLIARSGTAISTELGNMVVHNEIELLHAIGISPFSYLVTPRVTGIVISMFSLTLYFNVVSMLSGGLFYELFYDVHMSDFFNSYLGHLTLSDFFMPVIKSILFGMAIGLICTYQGLKVGRASTEVPQRTMRAVVYSVLSIIVLNILVTLANYELGVLS